MGQILNNQFVIKVVKAVSIRKCLTNSQNQPFIIEGININTGEQGFYVLKPNIGNRMYSGATMKELLASLMALELDINVPEPVIVEINEDFTQLYKGKQYHSILVNSSGKNFGTRYLEGLPTWTDANYDNPLLHQAIQETFVFDTFIENADRNRLKPNMLIGSDKIYLIDHELAFSFVDLILYNNPTPWVLTENDCNLAKNHLFYNFIRGKNFCCSNLLSKMVNLNPIFWETVESYLPFEWRNDKFNIIKSLLSLRISDIKEFQNGIERLLK